MISPINKTRPQCRGGYACITNLTFALIKGNNTSNVFLQIKNKSLNVFH